jgi:hypothetical protein
LPSFLKNVAAEGSWMMISNFAPLHKFDAAHHHSSLFAESVAHHALNLAP